MNFVPGTVLHCLCGGEVGVVKREEKEKLMVAAFACVRNPQERGTVFKKFFALLSFEILR